MKVSQNVNAYIEINLERNQLEEQHKTFFIMFIMSSSKDLSFFDLIFALRKIKTHLNTVNFSKWKYDNIEKAQT